MIQTLQILQIFKTEAIYFNLFSLNYLEEKSNESSSFIVSTSKFFKSIKNDYKIYLSYLKNKGKGFGSILINLNNFKIIGIINNSDVEIQLLI